MSAQDQSAVESCCHHTMCCGYMPQTLLEMLTLLNLDSSHGTAIRKHCMADSNQVRCELCSFRLGKAKT